MSTQVLGQRQLSLADRNKWIFHSLPMDLLFILLPSLYGLSAWLVRDTKIFLPMIAFAIFIQSLHLYSTLMRVYFNKVERQKLGLLALFPFIVFPICYYLGVGEFDYLIGFNLAVTVFHNVRQVHGFNKWYQRLNNAFDNRFDLIVYSVCLFPYIIAFVRYSNLWTYEDAQLIRACLISIYIFYSVLLIIKELNRYFKSRQNLFRPLILISAIMNYSCFIYYNDQLHMTAVSAFYHGWCYMGAFTLSAQRIDLIKIKNFTLAFFVTCLLSYFLMSTEVMLRLFATKTSANISHNLLLIAYSLFTTIVYSHYFFDMFIWRRKHNVSEKIFV